MPFPVDALPEPIRGFVAAGAKAIGCDASFIALPLLTAMAAAIGNTRRIQLKRGWTAPAILWVAIVGESGTAKTPAFKLACGPSENASERRWNATPTRCGSMKPTWPITKRRWPAWKRHKTRPTHRREEPGTHKPNGSS